MRQKMISAAAGAMAVVWLYGVLSMPAASAQTTTDQTDQTAKTKKKKKSAKSTEAPSAQSSETPSAATTPAETGKKAKKSKKSAEVPPQSFVPPATGNKAEESAAPVKNATSEQIQSAKSGGMVWVNTDSGIYHKGGRWYGKTKQGKFMTEDEAVRAGYKAAKNEK
ncbi:MAG TPA: hypothetical protein VKV74_09425 [Bryobacteraceae bacterium]|nr:hypothetical protein [Bryobacteraceae bacterium]